ncbi:MULTISPECIES: Lrp/AsnC family transcriptional regulator [unclassified Undibacterium]|uniref:Lrp/AsnC family transcriptional regulator n=1 Tax=unclassified Undibacterium TaxID=2630295 RepID=UPI002AC9025B|nr:MULTISPECIES: Lrp/AsnC family transcriptional regulator [unclassified Undibacterium]MEB0138145.1 Lrp/AsnC family transcriptional regulator [Undibacterium sp. CCC2.1]MEB0171100.1 Lrp/AsnC family transcriptional regulator [Undibacterium sp. CCC1.1]MEB0175145.1 Lrp/AsnC family transcriptional regulator [Undibacterium sp. CCC3.4]MEB0214271.1 Lrp/AsnC family transcriptional regulator [Undibacterium sp. 5I2]WPX41851.1 Lrp/AsnC family transcriptional regulator [Undibacterium sp. CCC3.4]
MPQFRALDKLDRKLLNQLQKDNQIPTRSLAEKLHISQPTCLRRIRELREAGVINAEVSMVDPFALGYGMLAFLEVSLTNQGDEFMHDFEARMNKESEVMQCYFVSGEYDYFLVVHVIDMDGYYQFVRRAISGSGNVRHFHSRFPMKKTKFSTRIGFDEKATELLVRVKK